MFKAVQSMIGDRLKELREKNDLLQREVGAALNIDAALVSKMESGAKFVSREYLDTLANLFQIDKRELEVDWLSSKLIRLLQNEPYAFEALKKTMNELK
jgi:transcriptional regulator with XRE-family HTH domain